MAIDTNSFAPDNRDLSMFPGEYGYPFFGKTIEFVKDTLAVCADHYERFGPVSRLDMVKNQRVLMCLGPEFNEAALFDPHGNFSAAGGYMGSLGGLYPDGMLLRDGKKHKKTRRASQPAFKTDALRTYVDMLNPIQSRRIDELKPDEEFIFYDNIQQTLMDVAAKVFIGLDETSAEAKMLHKIFENINKGLITPVPYDLPFSTFRKALKSRESLRNFLVTKIPERRGTELEDMFSRYCNAKDEDENYLEDVDIDGHIAFLLFAAFDTTTSALTNILYYLGKNPEWQEKVRDEINNVSSDIPSYDDMAEMKLTEYVFQETLRFYPSVMILNRRTTRDVEVGGYEIPANTVVMISPPFTHRMEEWWTNPLEFDPMRFSPDRAEHKRHGFSYIPFGGGAHKCIGMHFAMMNAKLYLFRLLKQYKVNLPNNYDPRFQHVHLPRPEDGLPITLTKI